MLGAALGLVAGAVNLEEYTLVRFMGVGFTLWARSSCAPPHLGRTPVGLGAVILKVKH